VKISLNWLKKYIDLSNISFDEIEYNLTMSGLEVESFEDQNKIYDGFIVGFVKEKEKHPNADKLSLCKVFDGENELQIVCGAPNVEKGQKIVLGKIGAVVPSNQFKLSKAKIRGFESFGMICSEAELLISNDHSGIMVLDPSLKEGTPISEALKLNDIIFEIGITPNRPDALCHLGTARDIAAIFKKELIRPSIKPFSEKKYPETLAKVTIQNPELCPRYSAKVVKNVTIKESPDWLKVKIKAVGLRPINNVVDVTNFVNLELGQPLHAFDLDKVSGKHILVKTANNTELFTTLDSKERKLNPSILMICDEEKPVAIAGVMGGENSEVTEITKNILIESAYFNPSSVRKTSKFLGLSTDSSYRFERGCNPAGTLFAAQRAAELIQEVGGGEIVDGCIDEYPVKIEEPIVKLRLNQIERILGYSISKDEVKSIFKSLEFEVVSEEIDSMLIKIPLFRPDCSQEIDLIEEIARIYGYNNIPEVERIAITLEKKNDDSSFTGKLKNFLVGLGLNETYGNTLVSEKTAGVFGNSIKLLNAQSSELSFLRTSLIPGALELVARNINVSEKDLSIFEIGSVFNKINDNMTSFEDFSEEQNMLILLTGQAIKKQWLSQDRKFDVFDLKGYTSALLKNIFLDNFTSYIYNADGISLFNLNFALVIDSLVVGHAGRIERELLKQFGIEQDVYCAEISVTKLKKKLQEINEAPKFKELLRFPKIQKDFAFVFDSSVQYEDIYKFIRENCSELLKEVSLFDIYESDSLGTGKRSLAFNLVYFDNNKTLTDEEIDKDFFGLIKKIENHFKATLRGS